VPFVQIQGRLAIELEQLVPTRARDPARDTEGIPTSSAPVTKSHRSAVEAHGSNGHGPWRRVSPDTCFLEAGAISRQSSADTDRPSYDRCQPADELATV